MRRVGDLFEQVREVRERFQAPRGAREPQQLAWSLGPAVPKQPPSASMRVNVRRRLRRGIAELEEFIAEVGAGRIGAPRVEGTVLWVSLRARDDELYHLEIRTRSYPAQPPSCRFVSAEGHPVLEAWPAYVSRGPFRPPDFICSPPTAEFYEYHSDRRYRPEDGTLVPTVSMVYVALQSPVYQGRWDAEKRARQTRPGARPF